MVSLKYLYFKEINTLKSSVSTQKISYDELIQQERIRIRKEEEKKQVEIEDRLRTLNTAKDEIEVRGKLSNFLNYKISLYFKSRYNQQLIAYRELQQKLNLQSVEIESFQRQVELTQIVIF